MTGIDDAAGSMRGTEATGTLTPEARTAGSPIDCSAATAAEAMSCSSALTRAVVQNPAITSVMATRASRRASGA